MDGLVCIEGDGVALVARHLERVADGRICWQTLSRVQVRYVDEVLDDTDDLLNVRDTDGVTWRIRPLTVALYNDLCRTPNARRYPNWAALEAALTRAFDLAG